MSRNRLADLAQLAAILKDRSLADLAAANRDRDAISEQIGAIEQGIRARARAADEMQVPDPASLTGTDIRWRSQAEKSIRTLRSAEAQARLKCDEARGQAARDLGRSEVLAKLSRRKI